MPNPSQGKVDPVKTALDALTVAAANLHRDGGVEVAGACERARRELEPVLKNYYTKQGWNLP